MQNELGRKQKRGKSSPRKSTERRAIAIPKKRRLLTFVQVDALEAPTKNAMGTEPGVPVVIHGKSRRIFCNFIAQVQIQVKSKGRSKGKVETENEEKQPAERRSEANPNVVYEFQGRSNYFLIRRGTQTQEKCGPVSIETDANCTIRCDAHCYGVTWGW